MKHIKIYEDYKELPEIGDYVVVDSKSVNIKFNNYVNNNVGKLNHYGLSKSIVWVEYFSIPEELKQHFDDDKYAILEKNRIVYFSSDEKNAELYLKTMKFNI